LVVGGSTAVHIRTSSSPPAMAATRMPIPRIRAVPMASSATMKSMSAQAAPAIEW
jgi:hypothetical protein